MTAREKRGVCQQRYDGGVKRCTPPRMRICLFLLLGGIVNVAVAWGCFRWSMGSAERRSGPYTHYRGLGVTRVSAEFPTLDAQGRTIAISAPWIESRSGWPFLCLYAPGYATGRVVTNPQTGDLIASPLWPGFAINTVFYAAILCLLFAAPFALRRRRRIKRGLCPACAYPVGDSEVCTECGKPAKPRP